MASELPECSVIDIGYIRLSRKGLKNGKMDTFFERPRANTQEITARYCPRLLA
jgi:hypothetical protein